MHSCLRTAYISTHYATCSIYLDLACTDFVCINRPFDSFSHSNSLSVSRFSSISHACSCFSLHAYCQCDHFKNECSHCICTIVTRWAISFRSLSNSAIANGITESKMDLRIHITHKHVARLCVHNTFNTVQTFNNFNIYFKIEICVFLPSLPTQHARVSLCVCA